MSRTLRALAALAATAIANTAAGQLPIFTGDPVDGSGTPYTILPGVGSVQPGDDDTFNTTDDGIAPATIGDVDIVVRMGGGYAGGAIPTPAAGVAAAQAIVPGGTQLGGGTEVPFQVIVSDGASSPAAGNPLLGAQHDSRAVVVLAYPDLDGDGFIGPTASDGSSDDAVERQETMTVIGRQAGLIQSGVAGGGLAVSLGAPASAGGLGVVIVAGALMGDTAPRYFDGPWAGTLMPAMPPINYEDLIGGGNGTRAPDGVNEEPIEIAFEYEKWFMPAPNHPQLGTPYAIPTNGSSISNDLLRAESGPATSALLAVPVQAAGFVADPARRLLPAVDGLAARLLAERVDTISLADDGSDDTTLLLLPIDLLGNPADPSSPISVTVEAPAGLALISPDTDTDTSRETISLNTAAAVELVVADAGGASDRIASVSVVAIADGAPVSAIEVTGGTGTCGNSVLDGFEQCDDGNSVALDGCEPDCTLSLLHDSIVLPVPPVQLSLSSGSTTASKSVKVKVRNGDVSPSNEQPGHTIRLIAQDGDCPAGTVGLPDFDRSTAGAQDSILLAGGKTAKALVTITASSAGFTSANRHAPMRCTASLSVVTDDPVGNTDPAPDNDSTPLEIVVTDDNDGENVTGHESSLTSLKPVTIKIAPGAASAQKTVKITAVNGDVVPDSESPGHTMTVAVSDGNCPVGTISNADFDSSTAGSQSSVVSDGGRKARGAVTLNVSSTAFQSRSRQSPDRCTAQLTVSGPGGDAVPSNDSIGLVIDVTDGNDY